MLASGRPDQNPAAGQQDRNPAPTAGRTGRNLALTVGRTDWDPALAGRGGCNLKSAKQAQKNTPNPI